MKEGYAIYVKHLGKERADAVSDLYAEREGMMKEDDSCCDKKSNKECCKDKKEISMNTEVICPECGHRKMETMPSDFCVIRYTCSNCHAELYPKDGDCCVFCSYGTHKCPSKQG